MRISNKMPQDSTVKETIDAHPEKRLGIEERNSRLRLGGVVAQGDTLALDFVETLLTEVVPVSKKPIFW